MLRPLRPANSFDMLRWSLLAVPAGILGFSLFKRPKKLQRRTIVFSRYPQPGSAKTRLIPKLGPFGAALAQRYMTEKIVKTASSLQKPADVELRFHGGTKTMAKTWLKCIDCGKALCKKQADGDLGIKMASAIENAFREGARRVVIVGSDIPGITGEIIEEAFERLENHLMVLGPALDGGYYLVGLSREALDVVESVADLFSSEIQWGGSSVFAQQRRRAQELGVSLAELSSSLNDIDIPDDIPVFEEALGISSNELLSPSWSVIIPTLNEAHQIESTLQACLENAQNPDQLEIVVVDGGSSDSTVEIVEKFGKGSNVKIIRSERGRGRQLQNGVMNSSKENLLFLHADTRLPRGYDVNAFETLATPGVKLGAFKFNLDLTQMKEEMTWWLRLQLWLVNWGTRHRSEGMRLPYGDQAYFMRRQDYEEIGGFKPIPLMEDYEFLLRVRSPAKERVKICDGPGVTTSARRWLKRGYLRTTGFNTFILAAYHCGMSPEILAKWY